MTRSDTSAALPPPFDPPPASDEWREAVRSGRIVMNCETPKLSGGDDPLPLPLRVSGWAYTKVGIDAVTVVVDDTPVRASYGRLRRDVADFLTEPDAAHSGFTAFLDPDICEPGPHRLSVVAVDRDQRAVGITTSIVAELSKQGDAAAEAPGRALQAETQSLDHGGERYVPELHRGSPVEAEHQSRYNWAAPLAAGREVLDAGCGVGWGTVRLARAGAHRAVGVDIDEGALVSARERAGEHAEFVRGDLMSLPFDGGSFDLVVSFEAIEHVEDPRRALDEFRRVLRPRGLLVVSSPNKGVYPAGNPFHLYELTSEELEASLRERFRNVAMYRQQTHLGSLLTDDCGHAADDPTVVLDARLYKMSRGEAGDELYTIGLAGDDELPSMQAVAVISAPLEQYYEEMTRLSQRALSAEIKYLMCSREIEQLETRHEQALAQLEEAQRLRAAADEARGLVEHQLAEHRSSVSWRITVPLRVAKRAARRRRAPAGD